MITGSLTSQLRCPREIDLISLWIQVQCVGACVWVLGKILLPLLGLEPHLCQIIAQSQYWLHYPSSKWYIYINVCVYLLIQIRSCSWVELKHFSFFFVLFFSWPILKYLPRGHCTECRCRLSLPLGKCPALVLFKIVTHPVSSTSFPFHSSLLNVLFDAVQYVAHNMVHKSHYVIHNLYTVFHTVFHFSHSVYIFGCL
jgi:hypothetical protein